MGIEAFDFFDICKAGLIDSDKEIGKSLFKFIQPFINFKSVGIGDSKNLITLTYKADHLILIYTVKHLIPFTDEDLLPALGKVKLVKRPARTGRNPMTGETIKIKAKKVVKVVACKALKDAVLG